MIKILKSLLLISLFTSVALASKPRIVEWDELMPPGYLDSLIELTAESSFSITNIFSFDDDTEEAQKRVRPNARDAKFCPHSARVK